MARAHRASEDPKVRATAARFYVELVDELRRVYEREAARGLKKADLARVLGVHRSVVSRMLSGENGNITAGSIGALAGAMGHYPEIVLRPYDSPAGNRNPAGAPDETTRSGVAKFVIHGRNGEEGVPHGSSLASLRREDEAA